MKRYTWKTDERVRFGDLGLRVTLFFMGLHLPVLRWASVINVNLQWFPLFNRMENKLVEIPEYLFGLPLQVVKHFLALTFPACNKPVTQGLLFHGQSSLRKQSPSHLGDCVRC